jgi:hypothetical protein
MQTRVSAASGAIRLRASSAPAAAKTMRQCAGQADAAPRYDSSRNFLAVVWIGRLVALDHSQRDRQSRFAGLDDL